MGLYITAAAMENDVEIPQKIKNRAATRPTKPLLGIYPQTTETRLGKDTLRSCVHCGMTYNSEDVEAT